MNTDDNVIDYISPEAVKAISSLHGKVVNVKELMQTIRLRFYLHNPFWSVILSRIPIHVVPVDSPIRTAAVDGRAIYLNPLFMCSINEESQKFVIAHELLHLINLTFPRQGSREHRIWNLATDYANNQMLHDNGFRLPTTQEIRDIITQMSEMTGVDQSTIEKMKQYWGDERVQDVHKPMVLYDEKYRGMLAEEIYEELINDPNNCKYIEGLDIHIVGGTEMEGKRGMSDADRQRIEGILAQAKIEASMKPGSIPAGLQRYFDQLAEPKISWKDELDIQAQTFTVSDYTWSPPDPAMFSIGITMPYIEYDQTLRVKIAIDTSGSISEDDIRNVMTEIVGISRNFPSFELTVFCCDTQVYGEKSYDKSTMNDLLSYEVIGGGGTAFRPVFDNFEETADDFDWHIFFTDGYGEGWCEDMEGTVSNMLWLINQGPHSGDSHLPTWGKTIRYDQYI